MDETAFPGRLPERDRPWVMRTYAGHSSAAATNALFRRNLAKGQTGLSVAFDLPTQTGYDPDHELAAGEVGRVGVPVAHLGDMRALFDGIPLADTNTSMTINAPAMWLLALYGTVGDGAGRRAGPLRRHHPERHHQGVPVPGHVHLPAGGVAAADRRRGRVHAARDAPSGTRSTSARTTSRRPAPRPCRRSASRWPPRSPCSTRSVTPARCRPSGWATWSQRISFFVNAGVRFVEEIAKMRAFGVLWDEITRDRYGVTDARQRRFRYGVQVNSLGLTEAQPENNIQRIVLEMLGVTLSRDARARAVQLPAWNEALGLPRPWDQQWSLRMQQVLAYESDLLEYPDLFEGSHVMTALVDEIVTGARVELDKVLELGGVVAAVETGYLKSALVASLAERRRRMESGADVVVGVNRFTETEPSPLTAAGAGAVEQVDPAVEAAAVEGVRRWRADRDAADVDAALARLRADAATTTNLMPATLECVRAGVTTGEWAGALRQVFGEYRAPTGLAGATGGGGDPRPGRGPRAGRRHRRASWAAAGCGCWSANPAWTGTPTAPSRSRYAPATPASRSSTRASG